MAKGMLLLSLCAVALPRTHAHRGPDDPVPHPGARPTHKSANGLIIDATKLRRAGAASDFWGSQPVLGKWLENSAVAPLGRKLWQGVISWRLKLIQGSVFS